MMTLFRRLFPPLIILAIGLFLRLHSLAAYAPFDWDQNRDYQAVAKIADGKLTLIGPVAKGEGGFFLGPLYYYLLLPLFFITHGDPIALPLTSVILDVLAIALILRLGHYLKQPGFGYLFALFWAVSPSAIAAARISWNVALLPLWLVAMFFVLFKSQYQRRDYLLLGVITGLSWHIHAAMIPLAPLLPLARTHALALKPRRLTLILFGYFLALSPLLIFEVRHAGLQSQLLKSVLENTATVRAPLAEVVVSALARYGKNLAAFFGGQSDLNLPLGIVAAAAALLVLARSRPILRLAALTILLNLLLLTLLGEVGFPEYYLAAATFGTCLILAHVLARWRLTQALALGYAVFLLSIPPTPSPYSLKNKLTLARALAADSRQVALIYDLPFGRDSGLPLLIARQGVVLTPNPKTIMLITEKNDPSPLINGELATELGWFGAFRLLKRDVQ